MKTDFKILLFFIIIIFCSFNLLATLNFSKDGIRYQAESTSSTTATVVGFDNDENATYSIPEKVSYYGMSFDVNDIILSTSYTFYKLIIPKTISNIENFPTYDKNSYSCLRSLFVKSIEVDPENEHYGVIDNRFVYSKVNQDLLYYNEDDITTEITIPEEVKNIKSGAISSSILTKVSILHKCSLEEDAFLWCSSLSTLEFDFTDEDLSNVDDKPKYSPAGIHKCGEAKQNNLLKTLIFGKNFYDNSILNSLLFNLYSIDNYIIDPANQYFSSEGRFLYNKDKTALLRVPATAFYESDYIIPEGIETIGDYAFYEGSYGCEYRYDSLVYPSTLKSLSSKQSLSSVNEINFEKCDKLYVIPSYAFAHTDIGAIKFPKNLKFIDTYAFYHQYPGAHRVLPDTLVLPESLDSIGFFAINCTQELVLPSNLKKIQQSNINSNVIVSKSITPPECEDYSIYMSEFHCDVRYTPFNETAFSSSLLIVPKGYKDVYENAPVWKEFANIIEAAPDCDVNEDNVTNAADVTAIYNYILNGDERFKNKCDVNGDKVINAADVTFIYNNILGIEGQ